MRTFSFIYVLAALVVAVTCASLPLDRSCVLGCGLAQLENKRSILERPTLTVRDLTNAELLRRGLPLKYPVLRRGTPVRRTDPSAGPSPKTITHRGIIQVIRQDNNAVYGYVSRTLLQTGISIIALDAVDALIVTFETDQTGSGSALNIAMENADSGFPFLGLVQGIGNTDSVLAPGSPDYTVLATTAETAPGSPPALVGNSFNISLFPTTSESAIWTFDGSNEILFPRWVNPDGSLPPVQVFTIDLLGIAVGGDFDAFRAQDPTSSVIILKFIPL